MYGAQAVGYSENLQEIKQFLERRVLSQWDTTLAKKSIKHTTKYQKLNIYISYVFVENKSKAYFMLP